MNKRLDTGWARWAGWAGVSLGRKLFISYFAVVLIGVVTVFLLMSTLAPDFFSSSMHGMMSGSGGTNGMMGSQGASNAVVSANIDAAFQQALMQSLVVAALLATAAALAVSYFVSRQIASPVQRMLTATRRIGAGHYAERVVVPSANAGDELGQLAASFNDMAGELERTERRRVELVGDVAHELRTPITTLTGYLEGLLDGVVEPSPETWAKLHTESQRLRRLVDDLQELSRAEARQLPMRSIRISPESIVTTAQERVAPLYAEKRLALQIASSGGMPDVLADPDRATQVMTNLLTNALRYTPASGSVEVSVARQGNMVAFRVRDTGVGIAPEDLPRVFERFYRVEKSRARALGGSGIGLTISKALAEAMRGSLTAESAGLSMGSVFTFTLPLA
ncbi:MAG TPA: ATP-binding protein [Ktedonobacterales bacterium]|jgi:signal transduction histidine kinase|nr:ATP-binding protein [Ktedonobacterales bacterium]